MRIILDYENGVPIYEQIKSQVKRQILSGQLPPGEMLPSIRTLAKELKIGIITAKRAYDDLTAEGFTCAVQGKGVFVGNIKADELSRLGVQEVEELLKTAAVRAKNNGLSKEDALTIFDKVWRE